MTSSPADMQRMAPALLDAAQYVEGQCKNQYSSRSVSGSERVMRHIATRIRDLGCGPLRTRIRIDMGERIAALLHLDEPPLPPSALVGTFADMYLSFNDPMQIPEGGFTQVLMKLEALKEGASDHVRFAVLSPQVRAIEMAWFSGRFTWNRYDHAMAEIEKEVVRITGHLADDDPVREEAGRLLRNRHEPPTYGVRIHIIREELLSHIKSCDGLELARIVVESQGDASDIAVWELLSDETRREQAAGMLLKEALTNHDIRASAIDLYGKPVLKDAPLSVRERLDAVLDVAAAYIATPGHLWLDEAAATLGRGLFPESKDAHDYPPESYYRIHDVEALFLRLLNREEYEKDYRTVNGHLLRLFEENPDFARRALPVLRERALELKRAPVGQRGDNPVTDLSLPTVIDQAETIASGRAQDG